MTVSTSELPRSGPIRSGSSYCPHRGSLTGFPSTDSLRDFLSSNVSSRDPRPPSVIWDRSQVYLLSLGGGKVKEVDFNLFLTCSTRSSSHPGPDTPYKDLRVLPRYSPKVWFKGSVTGSRRSGSTVRRGWVFYSGRVEVLTSRLVITIGVTSTMNPIIITYTL